MTHKIYSAVCRGYIRAFVLRFTREIAMTHTYECKRSREKNANISVQITRIHGVDDFTRSGRIYPARRISQRETVTGTKLRLFNQIIRTRKARRADLRSSLKLSRRGGTVVEVRKEGRKEGTEESKHLYRFVVLQRRHAYRMASHYCFYGQ